LTTLSTFTWGKLITDDGNPPLSFVASHMGGAQDSRDLQYEHSISPQDVKYSFTGQVSYDLPVGNSRAVDLRGVSNAILGGWTINGILYLSTACLSTRLAQEQARHISISGRTWCAIRRMALYTQRLRGSTLIALFNQEPKTAVLLIHSFRERPQTILTTFV